jgi:exonuclease SbcC
MRIDRLSLKGLLRFTDPIALDLSTIPAGSLIAIVGSNGAGKTTLLESMFAAFYRELPSRPDRELVDYAGGRDSFIDVEATFDGRGTYRARVSLDGVKRNTDAVLELVTAGGQRQVLNDGKVSTFDPVIARDFPKKSTVLASAFSAQNKQGAFSSLDRKGRRELFSALLDLDQLEQYATTARAAAGALDRRLAELRALRDRVKPLVTDELAAQLDATGNALGTDLLQVQTDRELIQRQLDRLEGTIQDLRANAARAIAAEAEQAQLTYRRADLVAERSRLADTREGLRRDEARELARIEEHRNALVAERQRAIAALPTAELIQANLDVQLRNLEARLSAERRDREERIAGNEALLNRGPEIRAAVAEMATIDQQLGELRTAITEAERAIREAERDLEAKRAAVRSAEQQVNQRDQATRSAALIETVPCGGADAFAHCQFLQDAVEARRQLVAFADVDGARTNAMSLASAALLDLDGRRAVLADGGARVESLQQRQDELRPDVDRLPKLEAAEDRVSELRAQIETLTADAQTAADLARQQATEAAASTEAQRRDLDAAIVQATEAATREADETRDRYTGLRGETATRAHQLEANLTDTDRLIASLASVVTAHAAAREQLAQAERDQAAQRLAWDDSTFRLTTIQEQVRVFERRREEFNAQREEYRRLDLSVRQLETDLIDWTALAKIFGRDGLPVLEIDAAGPTVSALANDLLQACYGGRFTMDLVTQEAKASGKGSKEVFELKVFDAERGGDARDLTDLSGGEQIIVEEALKSALAMYVNQRSTHPVRTIWRDETVGALDGDNAIRYVHMLRRLVARSGSHHLFFISHTPDASAMADVQLHVHDGRVDVVYPPFAPASSEAA